MTKELMIDGDFKIVYGPDIRPRQWSAVDWIQEGQVRIEVLEGRTKEEYRKILKTFKNPR